MRVRVRFRYRADTGEVEMFRVDDLQDGARAADHDARHDAATVDVARVVDANPLVIEVSPHIAAEPRDAPRQVPHDEPGQREDRRHHE